MPEKELLDQIIKNIFADQGVNCYFCQIIGQRWAFITGSSDVLAAPVKYQISSDLGIIADKEISNLNQFISSLL